MFSVPILHVERVLEKKQLNMGRGLCLEMSIWKEDAKIVNVTEQKIKGLALFVVSTCKNISLHLKPSQGTCFLVLIKAGDNDTSLLLPYRKCQKR